MDEKVIIMHGLDREETLTALRAVKKALQEPEKIAFATSTPNNLDWKLSDVVTEVAREHREMQKIQSKEKNDTSGN